MNSRERVLTALQRTGKPDKTPFEISWGSFTPQLMRTYREHTRSVLSPEEYFDYDTRFVLPGPTRKKTDFTKYYPAGPLPEGLSIDEWGVGYIPTRYEIQSPKFHPLASLSTVEEINAYPWPDLDEDYRYEEALKKTKEYQQRGYAVCGEMYQTIFETAWLMRNMEQFMIDLVLNEDIAHIICDNITRIRIKQARLLAKIGVDIIRLGDDIVSQQGLMMSPEIYSHFFKPRLKKIIRAAKEENPDVIIFMHSCGKVEEVIEDFIDAGVEVLNPLQPECNDLKMIHDRYKDRLSFWGGIGVQNVMPFGTPDEVTDKVKETNDLLGSEGGFLLAPAHILDPSVPWQNVIAYIEAAKNTHIQIDNK